MTKWKVDGPAWGRKTAVYINLWGRGASKIVRGRVLCDSPNLCELGRRQIAGLVASGYAVEIKPEPKPKPKYVKPIPYDVDEVKES